jgi:integrase
VKGTKADAENKLNEIMGSVQDGTYVSPSPREFGEFLDEWLDQHAAKKCSPKTVERYRQLVEYLPTNVTRCKLHRLSSLMLERAYWALLESGGRDGRPLSAKTVHSIAGVVSSALSKAVVWKLIKVSPAKACELPSLEPKEAAIIEDTQFEWLLDAARINNHDWLYPLLVVGSATGCRRGELLALEWPDVCLETAALSVSKSLEQTKQGLRIKSTKSRKARRFALPKLAIDALKVHRVTQQARHEDIGFTPSPDLVFDAPEGGYLKPDSVTAKVCLLASQCGLKGVSLHTLRHTHGSRLLSAGVPLPAVSKRLGHSSVKVTADIYSHSFSADELAAADAWDRVMGPTIKRPGPKSAN